MFQYTDPIGNGVLAAQNALDVYRDMVDSVYGSATTSTNAFERLGKIPQLSPTEFIEWPAFPITANVGDSTVDDKRFVFQDEYVEWRVENDGSLNASTITFTTEFPEYYEALAEKGESELIAGIQDAIPGANPTAAELFGTGFDPQSATPSQRADAFRAQTVIPFLSGAQDVPNPWNNNQKGILCLGQQFNTLGALFNLAKQCSEPNPSIPSTGQCAAVGGACGPSRNSDPRICTRAQDVARIPRALSLQDPVGVVILRLNGTWRLDGNEFDINDPSVNQGIWKISRNGRRATFKQADKLTVDNDPIVSGAQLSRLLDVGAQVISAKPNDLLPQLAAGTFSTRQVPLLTRNPR